MQARMSRESEVVVVQLSGRVDVETAVPFREACLKRLMNERVVFDFRTLSFVGSSGILPFLQTLQEFAARNKSPFKFSGVGIEFKKVFAATPLNVIEIFETPAQAVDAILNPRVPEPMVAAAAPVPMLAQQISVDKDEDTTGADFGLLSLSPEPLDGEGESLEDEA